MKLQHGILIGSLVALGATTFFVEPARSQAVDPVCEEDTSLALNEICGISSFKDIVAPSPSVPLSTSVRAELSTLYDHNPRTRYSSSRLYAVDESTPVAVAGYFQFADTPADPLNIETDDVVVTNIWARDLFPASIPPSGNRSPIIPDNSLTGFDPNTPEIVPLANEVFIGQSGTLYPADVSATVTLANLAAFLPGYDLSAFTGDPNSIVYVSQVTIPGADLLVSTPEPSTFLGLLTLGLLGSGLTYKRKRQDNL